MKNWPAHCSLEIYIAVEIPDLSILRRMPSFIGWTVVSDCKGLTWPSRRLHGPSHKRFLPNPTEPVEYNLSNMFEVCVDLTPCNLIVPNTSPVSADTRTRHSSLKASQGQEQDDRPTKSSHTAGSEKTFAATGKRAMRCLKLSSE